MKVRGITVKWRMLYFTMLFVSFLIISAKPSFAAVQDTGKEPILMQADELTYFKETKTITAIGNVELSQGGRILLADEINYNQNTDTVSAVGNVILLEPTGDVLFSSQAILSNELKDGVIKNLRFLMKDGSRLAANRAKRLGGNRKILTEAVFSPCKPCDDKPEEALVWQIRAKNVIHDEIEQNIEYENAVFELFDLPVLYIPYFTHPDPTVKRRSGILTPTIGHSDEKGFIFGQPYFYVFDEARDLKMEPIIYTREGVILRSQYRHALNNGNLDFKATSGFMTEDSNKSDLTYRGSIDFEADFSLDDTWRTSFNYEQSSNRNYQRKFDLDAKEILTSEARLEGFRQRNYLALTAHKFQGLRSTDDRRRQPIVFPAFRYSFMAEPNSLGSRIEMDLSLTSLIREIGTDSRKLSLTSGWQLPYYSRYGEIYTFSSSLQTDIVFSNNLTDPSHHNVNADHTKLRAIPQLALNWRYPWVRPGKEVNQTVEPIINIVVGPTINNSSKISNEDSQAFEFDDTNIFETNRYEGTDRITGGSRIDYGLKATLMNFKTILSELFVSQSYRFLGRTTFEDGSGLEDKRSDYVGRLLMSVKDWVGFIYRFRIDKNDLTPRRSEFGLSLNNNNFNFLIDYILLNEHSDTKSFGNREQIELNLNSKLDETWSSNMQLVQDLSNNSNRTRKASIGVTYSDECFTLGIKYQRKDLSDDEIEPEDKVLLLVNFRDLGSL